MVDLSGGWNVAAVSGIVVPEQEAQQYERIADDCDVVVPKWTVPSPLDFVYMRKS